MKKNNLITIAVIIGVIIIAFLILNKNPPETPEEIIKCIGENSVLYIQFGCHACEIQEDMFGENYKYLTTIDCFVERDKCPGITKTPTWAINNQLYTGVRSIEELKELTGC